MLLWNLSARLGDKDHNCYLYSLYTRQHLKMLLTNHNVKPMWVHLTINLNER